MVVKKFLTVYIIIRFVIRGIKLLEAAYRHLDIDTTHITILGVSITCPCHLQRQRYAINYLQWSRNPGMGVVPTPSRKPDLWPTLTRRSSTAQAESSDPVEE